MENRKFLIFLARWIYSSSQKQSQFSGWRQRLVLQKCVQAIGGYDLAHVEDPHYSHVQIHGQSQDEAFESGRLNSVG